MAKANATTPPTTREPPRTTSTPTTLISRITELVHACFTGIWIESREPDEAIRDLTQLARGESWRLSIWDCEVTRRCSFAAGSDDRGRIAKLGGRRCRTAGLGKTYAVSFGSADPFGCPISSLRRRLVATGGQNMNSHVDNRVEPLDALEAVEAWLARNFAHDQEHVLITAIRRNLVLDLSDVEIKEVLYNAAENECSGTDALRELLDADKSSEGMSRSSLKPR